MTVSKGREIEHPIFAEDAPLSTLDESQDATSMVDSEASPAIDNPVGASSNRWQPDDGLVSRSAK